ncbi:dihydroxyacetone kinase family protein [Microbacterium excoecariae]|uniref:dihydroxyacetone kinase family protein n=1 Tax=Microbacterium excoecariae TaxID=2715210 RepID=UPI0014084AE1|nr:dihydroxyacetone kinase family protein [Microbacterium excoecariae]NHI15728.1 dihydroxyacetone kinase family protein [Microbacterium excoecariae]
MTRLWNEPGDFADEMVDGFVAAHGRLVRRVTGGVARSTRTPDGEVAVVIGGGSGHYPAFAGLVGPGLAHGAAMGNLFASPSTPQVLSVARAAEQGGGVLLGYGNYAGDVLNFNAAQDQLRAAGIPCESIAVTDDVSSAPIDDRARRRGIAGDLTVFRIAAAAAAEKRPLAEVADLARRANERTRSFGVAFTGCSLPGADAPLFEVPEGRMAVGLGIHGEPGLSITDIPTADELAEMLVARLLDELPDGVSSARGARVVPILNGLGSLKYEEMFVVYRRIAQLLDDAGLVAVDPHVGEYCTSFDMAGTSLTLFWLDPELEALWDTPVDTPAYRRGGAVAPGEPLAEVDEEADAAEIGPSDDASRRLAAGAVTAFTRAAATIDEHVDELGRIDAIAGDGDHGIGMQRGVHAALGAARDAAERGAGLGTTVALAGDAWADRAGGTSGALWGMILRTLAADLGDDGSPDPAAAAAGLTRAAEAVMAYGKARPGDKTLVDALVPLAEAFERGIADGSAIGPAWADAARTAETAAAATADLMPRMGRARTHHEKALGTPDPGAHSLALLALTLADQLTPQEA